MLNEYAGNHSCSFSSGIVRQGPRRCTGGGRSWSGHAPAGLKDAFGAATRAASGSLTPGPLRARRSGIAVRPVACQHRGIER